MASGDYCAVYGCSNDRKKPDKAFRMDHLGKLRWRSPKDQKDILKWQNLLNIEGNFKVPMSTKACSNHFAGGYRSDGCTTLTLYLEEYTHLQEIKKRKLPSKRELLAVSSPSPPKKANSKVIDLSKKLHEKKELEKLKNESEGSKIQKKEQSNLVLSYNQVKDNDKIIMIIIIIIITTNNISISINKLQYSNNGYFCNLPQQ